MNFLRFIIISLLLISIKNDSLARDINYISDAADKNYTKMYLGNKVIDDDDYIVNSCDFRLSNPILPPLSDVAQRVSRTWSTVIRNYIWINEMAIDSKENWRVNTTKTGVIFQWYKKHVQNSLKEITLELGITGNAVQGHLLDSINECANALQSARRYSITLDDFLSK